jgi:putative glutamine amidotransferase
VEGLERAGGIGAVLQPVDPPPGTPAQAFMAERLRPFAGLLLTGGADVDPRLFGQSPHPAPDPVDPVVDRFETELCRAALALGVPLLAICRGLQVLNVALGGSLHQHIPDLGGVSGHGEPGGPSGRRAVSITAGSELARIVGHLEVESCCSHHQAVDRLGDGLVVTARSADGIVEALERAGRGGPWLVAVQWHPEKVAEVEADHQVLFDAFVDACRRARAPIVAAS